MTPVNQPGQSAGLPAEEDKALETGATSRRGFLGTAAGIGVSAAGWEENPAAAGQSGPSDLPRSRPHSRPAKARRKLAVVTTTYYYLSHAYHICGRFLCGYLRDGKLHHPDFDIVSMFVAQQSEGDLSRELAAKHGFRLCATVAEALSAGGDQLAVDGVLLIGEHGDYPYNEKGQKLYPRFELFGEIIAVFRRAGRAVPVFCDKHLSYSWPKAQRMVQTARPMGVPLMAGSSLPVTWRRPELELELGSAVTEALVASRGELEIFGIHALEALQCMVERRAQGPQGVRSVIGLEGDAVWRAGDDGLWSWELLEHALGRSDSLNVGDIRDNCRQFVPPPGRPTFPRGPVAFLVEYRDGLRASVLLLNGHVDDTTFAARLKGEAKPVSTLFYLPPPPGARFLEALTFKIEDFLATGRAPYPVERTLLTGGILDFALESRVRGQASGWREPAEQYRLETPDLDVHYSPPADSGFLRGEWRHPA